MKKRFKFLVFIKKRKTVTVSEYFVQKMRNMPDKWTKRSLYNMFKITLYGRYNMGFINKCLTGENAKIKSGILFVTREYYG